MTANISGAVVVPLTSYWWRADFTLEDCTMEEDAGRYRFRFHGEHKEYVPGMDTLEAALSLKLDENEPSPDVLKFINDYGPPRHTTEFLQYTAASTREVLEKTKDPSFPWQPLDGRETLEILQTQLERAEQEMARGPYETWLHTLTTPGIYPAFSDLQHVYLEWKATGEVQDITRHIDYLKPHLVQHEGVVVWEFEFYSLIDALYGLLAQSIVKGFSWKTCPNPNCRKEFISNKLTYCSDLCRIAFHDNKTRTESGRLRKSLSMTLKRRHDDGLISDAAFEKVSKQIHKAKTEEQLKDIKRSNAKIFARIPYGTTTKGSSK